jgi:hypothetical protein
MIALLIAKDFPHDLMLIAITYIDVISTRFAVSKDLGHLPGDNWLPLITRSHMLFLG